MIYLSADVYSPDGTTRLGAGSVAVLSANVQRALDGAARVSVTVRSADERALDLMTAKRIVRVYLDDEQHPRREIASFVIDDVRESGSGTRTIAGKDTISLLNNTLVGLGRVYDDEALDDVLTSLAGLAGWTLDAEAVVGTKNASLRFNGTSVLKAVQTAIEEKGLHIRAGDTFKELEVGAFGANTGLVAEKVDNFHTDVYENDNLLIIGRMTLTTSGADIVNAILPVGAGDGDSKLTLEKSTRGGMTTKTAPDGRTEYWLEDSASIAAYGRIERRVVFSQIAPITNSSTDVENAANALHDAASTWLGRKSDTVESYQLTVKKSTTTIKPGDKITVRYDGEVVNANGQIVDVRSVDDTFWVLKVTERWGVEGGTVDLDVASVDEYANSTERIIVGAIDEVEVNGIALKPFPFVFGSTYYLQIGAGITDTAPIYITDTALDLARCIVRIAPRPLRTNVQTAVAEGGGDHLHKMFDSASPGVGDSNPIGVRARTSTNTLDFVFLSLRGPVSYSGSIWTWESSGEHTHNVSLSYGFYDDTVTPSSIRVAINGTDKTSELGGPWNVAGGTTAFEIEISDILKDAGLQQVHEVRFSCDSGRGELVASMELAGTTSTIKPSL